MRNSLLPSLQVHLRVYWCEGFLNSDEYCLDLDARSSNFLFSDVPTKSQVAGIIEFDVIYLVALISTFSGATFCSFIVLLNINLTFKKKGCGWLNGNLSLFIVFVELFYRKCYRSF
jgi:hypothetical protein